MSSEQALEDAQAEFDAASGAFEEAQTRLEKTTIRAPFTGVLGLQQLNVGEYVDGQAHTNGIESHWAMLKRGYHGVYHKMSAKHLQRYVNEFSGRHNQRESDTLVQMGAMLRTMSGKRLRYADLVDAPEVDVPQPAGSDVF